MTTRSPWANGPMRIAIGNGHGVDGELILATPPATVGLLLAALT